MPAEADIHAPYARSGITSAVNIFLMQYLVIQIVTGNALYVSKDQLNRPGYTYVYNSCGVLHVFTVNIIPFIKNRIYSQFTNCATLTFISQFINGPVPCIVRFTVYATIINCCENCEITNCAAQFLYCSNLPNKNGITMKMERVLLALGCLASLTVAQQAGCNSLPNGTQVENLISANFAGTGQGSSSIVIVLQTAPEGFTYRVVCASSSGIRNQYRFVSIVAYYTNNGVGSVYGQFEFECVNSVWSATSDFLENTVFDRNTTLTSISAAVSANNRTDCGYCLNPTFSSPPRSTDAVNHCNS